MKWGKYRGRQRYKCKYCGKRFTIQKDWVEQAYEAYSIKGIKYSVLSQEYKKAISTIRRNFDKSKIKYHIKGTREKEINLVFDGIYFGEKLCYVVFRAKGQTIYFEECSETVENIARILKEIEKKGYKYKSFTVDGKKGIIKYLQQEYKGIPIQYCQFHQKRTIKRYLTGQPKTECGKEIKSLLKDLSSLSEEEFKYRLNEIKKIYKDFLKEKNESNEFKHKRIRSAIRSLTNNQELLFTYKKYPELKIPNTTNSCEGYFSQIRRKVNIHSGLKTERRKRLIEKLFCS